ncbi:MAG: hypothetical protein KAT05_13705 [Spirochaetes bacterium]|nr:hypothetical protein [Spirochaetota bacterium]
MNKKIILFLFFSFLLFNLSAQQTRLLGNFIKLVVSNNDGKFLLYGRNNIKDDWIPLLFEDFPPTSYFKFFKNQKQIQFGEEGTGRYSEIEIKDDKIYYFWQNTEIKIEIIYYLISSNISKSADTLMLDLNIINLTENLYSIEFFLCIDTCLGESTKNHFILPGNMILQTENEIPSEASLSYIQTLNNDLNIGANIIFGKNKQVIPNRIFFANWKRVEENIGLYKIIDGRNFDLKPYSVNDSAIFIEYTNEKIYPNKDHIYRFIISMKNDIYIKTKQEESKDKEVKQKDKIDKEDKTYQKDRINTENHGKLNLINLTLDDLLELLDKINQKLENGESLTNKDVELTNKILEEIKKNK